MTDGRPARSQLAGALRSFGGLLLIGIGIASTLYGIRQLLMAVEVFDSDTGEFLWAVRGFTALLALGYGAIELSLGVLALRMRLPSARRALATGGLAAFGAVVLQGNLGGFQTVTAVNLTIGALTFAALFLDVGISGEVDRPDSESGKAPPW